MASCGKTRGRVGERTYLIRTFNQSAAGLSKRETGISGRGSPGAAGPRSFLGSLPSGFCSYSLTI